MEKITGGEVEFQFLNLKTFRIKLVSLLTFLFEKWKKNFPWILNAHANFLFSSLFIKIETRKSAYHFCFSRGRKTNIWPFDTCIITDTQEFDLLSVLPGTYNHYLFVI